MFGRNYNNQRLQSRRAFLRFRPCSFGMTYESTITFTLDTICPWTYLAFNCRTRALSSFLSSNPPTPVTFTLNLAPYQLYPDFSPAGEDKYEWCKREKYNDSEDRMQMYVKYMQELGKEDGIEFDFGGGEVANTLHAHQVLQYLQDKHSPQQALAALSSLYEQYFSQRTHPSSP